MEKIPYKDLWLTDKKRIFQKVNKLKKEYSLFNKKNKKQEDDFFYKKFNLQRTAKFLYKIRKKQKKIIKELVKEYEDILKNIPCIIFLTGSLARGSNRINSDVDLTFLYPEEFFQVLNPIEEEISVFLTDILGYKGRDRVHTMTIYLPIEDKKLKKYDSKIEFINSNDIIEIKYRENYEKLLYEINNSKRDYEGFELYLKNNITIDKCEEWTYNFEIVYLNYEKYNICELISNLDKELLKKDNCKIAMSKLLHDLLNKIENDSTNVNQEMSIAEIKKEYKKKEFIIIYDFFAIIRRFLILNNNNIGMIDFKKYMNNFDFKKVLGEQEKNFWNYLYKYFWRLIKLEDIIKDLGYDLSSHCNKVISKEDLEKLYYKKFGETDILNLLVNDKESINRTMKIIIKNILEGENNV